VNEAPNPDLYIRIRKSNEAIWIFSEGRPGEPGTAAIKEEHQARGRRLG